MAERRVIWASTAGPGGIHDLLVAVAQTPLWAEWNMRHIATHRAGSQVAKVSVFVRSAVTLAVALIRTPPDVVHLHAVSKRGSMFRYRTLALMCHLRGVPVLLDVHPAGCAESVDWRRLDARYREASRR